MATAVRGERSVSMAANVTHRPARLHRDNGDSARVRGLAHRLYAGLALDWGCSVKTVECLLTGERSIIRRTADALGRAVQLGDIERVATWLDVIEAPLMGTGALPYTQVRIEAGMTDAAEDIAECLYEQHPCRETAEALIRKSAHDRLKAEQRERSLKELWGIA